MFPPFIVKEMYIYISSLCRKEKSMHFFFLNKEDISHHNIESLFITLFSVKRSEMFLMLTGRSYLFLLSKVRKVEL